MFAGARNAPELPLAGRPPLSSLALEGRLGAPAVRTSHATNPRRVLSAGMWSSDQSMDDHDCNPPPFPPPHAPHALALLRPTPRNFEGQTLFDVRDDQSIFVSLASYRDENCPTTLQEMFSKADRPEHLYIGLVQQVS